MLAVVELRNVALHYIGCIVCCFPSGGARERSVCLFTFQSETPFNNYLPAAGVLGNCMGRGGEGDWRAMGQQWGRREEINKRIINCRSKIHLEIQKNIVQQKQLKILIL